MAQTTSFSNASTAPRPSILGIWRLGESLHASENAEVCTAQPADAAGSPRWDYVIKRAVATNDSAEPTVEARRHIERSMAAGCAASHPNLVAILDASTAGTTPYVVMPRLEGETMQWHFDQPASVALPVTLWWTRQVAQALTALHARGWVHQDVKPSNVVVGSRGHVTLIDLGFAARLGDAADSTFRGTPAFAAPESLAAGGIITPAADVFSLGRVLWSWMTRVEWANDRVLEPLAELVETMVAEDPHERPTAETITRHLLRLEIESLGRHIGPTSALRRVA